MPAGKPAYIWSGTEWIPIGLQIGAKYQPGQPSASASTTGDLWIDSNTNIPYVWNGTSWVITSASVNLSAYLTTASASAIYAPIASPALTGIPTAPTASVGTDNTQIATTAFVYDQAPLFSNRNFLYNGAMQIHQRSASVAGITTTNYYTADRWRTSVATLGTWTQSVEADAPTGSGFRKSLKMLCTTADASPAAGDYCQIDQLLEGQDLQRIAKGTSAAQQLTLSFWVKSNLIGTYCVRLIDNDNSNRMVSAQYTISASATWERKTITFAADTTGQFDNDNAYSLGIAFWLAAGSTFTSGAVQSVWGTYTSSNEAPGQTNLASAINNYWQVTGVQLEIGSNASPFEFKKYEQDLSECQRYYQKSFDQSVSPGTASHIGGIHVMSWSDGNASGIVWPVTMRSAPIVTFWPTNSTTSGQVNSGGTDRVASAIYPSERGFSYISITSGAATNYVRFQYTASAEL